MTIITVCSTPNQETTPLLLFTWTGEKSLTLLCVIMHVYLTLYMRSLPVCDRLFGTDKDYRNAKAIEEKDGKHL